MMQELECNEQHHLDYIESYKSEGQAGYCKEGYYLAGTCCAACDKVFVPEKPSGPQEFKPNETKPAHFCKRCLAREKNLIGTNKQETYRPRYLHAFCADCYQSRLENCGKSLNSPRKKRNKGRPRPVY